MKTNRHTRFPLATPKAKILQLAVAAILSTWSNVGSAHDIVTTKVTWSKEVSRIIIRQCIACHSPGKSTFALTTYAEAFPWSKAIKKAVLARQMPPWQAVKGFAEFSNDGSLTQEETEIISNWVEGGAPEGDPSYAPAFAFGNIATQPHFETPLRVTEMEISADSKLQVATRIVAIRPKTLKPASNLQVIAMRPDGQLEPLLWIHNYNPAFNQVYRYKSPLRLPAGTIFKLYPQTAGSLTLFK